MLIYQEKDGFFFKLNTLAALAYILAVFLLTLVLSNPLYLCGLFLAVAAVIVSADLTRKWRNYMKYSSALVLLILLVNVIFVRAGSTVIWRGPVLWGIGRLKITLEAFCFGMGMGIRMLIIISIFCLYTYAVNPDKVLKLIGRWNNKGVLTLTLSTRLFPLMVMDFQRIIEIQRCRGVRFESVPWWRRIIKYFPVINIMLLSSLERSFQFAEAMHARGFGLTNRSYYNRELWRPRDNIITCTVLLSIFIGVLLLISGKADYSYYPVLQPLKRGDLITAVILSMLYMTPALLNWGWKKWLLLKARI